jgi:hypothetical protein
MQTAWKRFSGIYLLYKYQEKAGNSCRIEAGLFNILLPERGGGRPVQSVLRSTKHSAKINSLDTSKDIDTDYINSILQCPVMKLSKRHAQNIYHFLMYYCGIYRVGHSWNTNQFFHTLRSVPYTGTHCEL